MKTEGKSKTPKTKLDLVHEAPKYVAVVQKDCGIRTYDVKLVMEKLNCSRNQAVVLVQLAQMADANPAAFPKKASA